MISELEPMTQAFCVGFIGCLFSLGPVIMAGSIIYLHGSEPTITDYKKKIRELERENKELNGIIDRLILKDWYDGKESAADKV